MCYVGVELCTVIYENVTQLLHLYSCDCLNIPVINGFFYHELFQGPIILVLCQVIQTSLHT